MAVDFGNQNSFLKFIILFYNLTPLDILQFQKKDKKIFEQKFHVENQKTFKEISEVAKINRNLRKFMKFEPKKVRVLRISHLTDYLASESIYKTYSRVEIKDDEVKSNIESILHSNANRIGSLYIGSFTNLIDQKLVDDSFRFAILKSKASVLTSGLLLAKKQQKNQEKKENENRD